MEKRRIAVVTGARSEYGLLRWIIQYLSDSPKVELQLLVTGMHLSPEFGLTYKAILEDGFPISRKIEVLLSSDTPTGIAKSMGLCMISFSDAYEELKPDILLVLGDRFEIFAAVAAASVARIPIAHIHGGETTEGAVDEAFRHSITKMSHFHFTATEIYRKRVIQLGESPDRVFRTGAPGLDNIHKLRLLEKPELEYSLNFGLGEKSALVTFHPVTLEKGSVEYQIDELLKAIDQLNGFQVVFTLPNADTDGRIIIEKINMYVSKNKERAAVFTSLGQLRYLSLLKYVSLVIGNSSSGLTEVPSFKIPTINIGDRQRGRIKAKSVIECSPDKNNILKAVSLALSDKFQQALVSIKNPYEGIDVSRTIAEYLINISLDKILKKKFFDL
jgi:GDP/UDP-N,N'-diacetylbacillosamine 2-epimerase (hydrolysing)